MAHPADKYANATLPWMRYQPRRDTLTAQRPTMAERIPIAVKSGLRALGLNKFAANAFGSPIADVLGYSPVGAVAQSWDAGQAAAGQRGALGKVAGLGGGMALAALGAVPGGKALRGVARDAERAALKYPVAPRGEWYSDGDYLARGGSIVEMSPSEYLSKVRPLQIDDVSRDNIDDLKNHIKSGRTLDPLKIYANGKEDGRHRAHAALELGMDKVPVMTFGASPLAMDEASRMARAAEQGFTVDAYHGGPAGIEQLRGGHTGASWLADDAQLAGDYAGAGGAVYPVKAGYSNPLVVDRATDNRRQKDILKYARENGHDAVVFKNADDSVLGAPQRANSTVTAVFDPANIRSKFAAFDPAKRGSANLLAGLGLGGLGYGLMSGTNWSDPTQY